MDQKYEKTTQMTPKQTQIFEKLNLLSQYACSKHSFIQESEKSQSRQANLSKLNQVNEIQIRHPQPNNNQCQQKTYQKFLCEWQDYFPNESYEVQSKFIQRIKNGLEKSFIDQKIITSVFSQLSQFYDQYRYKSAEIINSNEFSKINSHSQQLTLLNQYKSKSVTQLKHLRTNNQKTIEIIQNNLNEIFQPKSNQYDWQNRQRQIDFNSVSIPNTSSLMLSSKTQNSKQYLLHCGQTILAINPSFALGCHNVPDKVILTSGNLDVLINFLKLMILVDKAIQIITTNQILSKFKYFVKSFVKMALHWENQVNSKNLQGFHSVPIQKLLDQICHVVQENRYYKCNGFLLLFSRNLMWQPSYDLTINDGGKFYLFQAAGVRQQKTIYAAWKKKVISQQRYTVLIFNPYKYQWISQRKNLCDQNICKLKLNFEDQGHDAGSLGALKRVSNKKTLLENQKIFKILRKSALFKPISDVQLVEIMEAGEICTLVRNQTIYHQKMPFDHVYIIISGEEILQSSMMLGYEEWLMSGSEKSEKLENLKISETSGNFIRAKSTFVVRSQQLTAFKVSIAQLNFQLFLYLPDIRKIIQIDLEKELLMKPNIINTTDVNYLKYLLYISKNPNRRFIPSNRLVQIDFNPQKKTDNSKFRIKIPQNEWISFCRQKFCFLFN